MINLLPKSLKKDILYARRNSQLAKLCALLGIVIAGVMIIGLAGIFYMDQSTKNIQQQVDSMTQELKSKKIDETQSEVESISNNLKLTSQVLSKQVLFSKLLKQIGAAMPQNTILTDLKIGKTDGGIDMTAIASDYNTASQVQVNLADPANKIFDKADLLNVTCGASTADARYPCTTTIRARFAKDNSFTYTGDTK